MSSRPSFILTTADVGEEAGKYPGSDEVFSFGRPIGRVVGLERLGLHVERLPPGHRTSYPHAEKDEEEFVFVLAGEVDVWLDGDLHRLHANDFAAFPAATGICHTFLNNGDREAVLLVGGERSKPGNKIFYPLNPEMREQKGPEWWDDAPKRQLGAHDGRARPMSRAGLDRDVPSLRDQTAHWLVNLWLAGFAIATILQTVFAEALAAGGSWQQSLGWQHEIAFWNAFVLIAIILARRTSATLDAAIVPALVLLSFALGTNHLIAALEGPRASTHWAGVFGNYLVVLLASIWWLTQRATRRKLGTSN